MLGCSAILVLEMHRFEFWPLAIVMALSLLLVFVFVFSQKTLEKPSRDMVRLSTEARGWGSYTTPSENSGAPAMAPNTRTRYNRSRGGSYGKLDSHECLRTISAKGCTVTIHLFQTHGAHMLLRTLRKNQQQRSERRRWWSARTSP